ncbi:hypothetical protein H8R01_03530 [Vibrio metschnikovii]|uniref:hypothetical protein n=1 Tax=Vibrio metschnikovii TaxID=28172 RepID=UPI0016459822|nr:hypothetical protein [Vibrio metschnikovii]MBC3616552.1 hypothetical protein [Vibrio metschnikovii]MBC5812407.1 hypothetical protein [Vibrio metschnikovii]
MPAEKLTKNKLIQIIVMLTILISAFTWRTITHYSTDKEAAKEHPTLKNESIDHENNQSLQYKNSQ